jgi:hypothetical protein
MAPESLPAGALSARAAGLPADRAWLRADPVHLAAGMHSLAMAPRPPVLSAAEAHELAALLNRQFPDEFALHVLSPECWAAEARIGTRFASAAPRDLAGENLSAHLPQGEDAPRWRALLNESQMLMHSHLQGDERELAPNSLWFWGTGELPREPRLPWASIASAEPWQRGLALVGGGGCAPEPAGGGEWLAGLPESGRHLAVPDCGEDELESRWFAPLAAALRAEAIGMLTVHLSAAGVSFEATRADLRRFWRRARPLAALLA